MLQALQALRRRPLWINHSNPKWIPLRCGSSSPRNQAKGLCERIDPRRDRPGLAVCYSLVLSSDVIQPAQRPWSDPKTGAYPNMIEATALDYRPRTLANELAQRLSTRILEGQYPPGAKLPREADLMREFGVSRTVVREAISGLQAGGKVETRHGVGTFVLSPEDALPFRIESEQLGVLTDVISLLEVRIGLETEGAALAAQRRTNNDIDRLRNALSAFHLALQEGRDAVEADLAFHRCVAQASGNAHFAQLLVAIGARGLPRHRLGKDDPLKSNRIHYLQRVQQEHEAIYNAIEAQDPEAARAAMRTHLSNSRDRLRKRQSQVSRLRKVSLLVR